MKDLEYKTRNIRMDDRTWKTLKEERIKSGLSWNRYILTLIDKDYKLKTIKCNSKKNYKNIY